MVLIKTGVSRELSVEEILIFMLENDAVGWNKDDESIHHTPKPYRNVFMKEIKNQNTELIDALIHNCAWHVGLCAACNLQNLDMIYVCLNNTSYVDWDEVFTVVGSITNIQILRSLLERFKNECASNDSTLRFLSQYAVFESVLNNPLYNEMVPLLIDHGFNIAIAFYHSAACYNPDLWEWMVDRGAILKTGLSGAFEYDNISMGQWVLKKALQTNEDMCHPTMQEFLTPTIAPLHLGPPPSIKYRVLFLLNCGANIDNVPTIALNQVEKYICYRKQKQDVVKQCLHNHVCSDLSSWICTFIPYE
jgi:hypothetical protein